MQLGGLSLHGMFSGGVCLDWCRASPLVEGAHRVSLDSGPGSASSPLEG